MAADDVAQVGDVGTIIRIAITDTVTGAAIDVSAATTKEIVLLKPDGTSVTKTAAFTTDGTDGKIQYVTVASDLNVAGTWLAQPHIVTATDDWKGATDSFRVEANL